MAYLRQPIVVHLMTFPTLFCICYLLVTNPIAAQEGQKSPSQRLETLKKKRLDLALKYHGLLEKEYYRGALGYVESLMGAKKKLLDAQLDLANSTEDRRRIYESALKNMDRLRDFDLARGWIHEELDQLKIDTFLVELEIGFEKTNQKATDRKGKLGRD